MVNKVTGPEIYGPKIIIKGKAKAGSEVKYIFPTPNSQAPISTTTAGIHRLQGFPSEVCGCMWTPG